MTNRTPTRRFVLAAGLSSVLLPGRAWPQSGEREVEGGIGGTGIVGILVDFGSLIVAGQRVETTGDTQFFDSFGAIPESRLQIGDSLTVEAARVAGGALVAGRVHVTYPLVGEVSSSRDGGRRLIVNGVEVVSERPAPGVGAGQRVAVSGLWRDTRVVASRISATPSMLDLVSGTVARRAARIEVGGLPVRGPRLTGAPDGSFATVIGQFDPAERRLIGDRVVRERFVGAAGPLDRLAVEGWLEPTREAPGFRVAGLGHSFARNLQLDGLQNQRLLLLGGYNGLFGVESAVRLPDTAEARRVLINRLTQ